MKLTFWRRLEELLRRLASLPEEWGPLLVSLLVGAVYLSAVIANINTEPDGATAAAYALITATVVFARILEGGSRIKWRALVTRINVIVVSWAGYSAALVWLLSETGPAMAPTVPASLDRRLGRLDCWRHLSLWQGECKRAREPLNN